MSQFLNRVLSGVLTGLGTIVFSATLLGATTVHFEGAISQYVLSGGATSLPSQLALGDTLKGSFTFDPATPATSIALPAPADFNDHAGAITDFSLMFTSGTSAGVSLMIDLPALSNIGLVSDPSASVIGGETIGVVARYQYDGAGLTDLSPTQAIFSFFDPTFGLLDSAILSEVDWNAILTFDPLFFTANLEFIDAGTSLAQVARVEFTKFELAPSTVPLPGGLPLLAVGCLALGWLRRAGA